MLKSALLVTTSIAIGAGSVQLLHSVHAATGPSVYNVYEATVKDEAAYMKALVDENVDKIIKENGGIRVGGGFNKAKGIRGTASGNRFVIIQYPNQAAFEKADKDGLTAWIDKHQPDAREVMVEGLEATK